MIANHPEREQIRLENVLSALGNPLRLEIIRSAKPRAKRRLYWTPKSRKRASATFCSARCAMPRCTKPHRIWQRPQGRENMISLRREDLDARFPGLLDTLLNVMQQP